MRAQNLISRVSVIVFIVLGISKLNSVPQFPCLENGVKTYHRDIMMSELGMDLAHPILDYC